MKRKGWKVKVERPEEIFGCPEKYYTKEEIKRYARSSSMKRAQERLTQRIIEILDLSPPSKVLDLGCGVGYSTEFLKELGFDVIGIDILDNMLKYVKERGLEVRKVDMRNLESYFKKEEFDAVVSTSALQWVSLIERYRVAKGCYYVLKQNGKIGIHFYPKSEEELYKTGDYFRRVGFKTKIVVDNPQSPRKRRCFLIGEK